MTPSITTIAAKKLVGLSVTMSFADNKTGLLWRTFMPKRNEIQDTVNSDLYSLQLYPSAIIENGFQLDTVFEKWALKEVSSFDNIPEGMQPFVLPGGLYAVFHYKGLSTDTTIFDIIFKTWLPQSAYVLDNRPHFEILGALYKNNDPASEEDIYIPIKLK
ncbi:MAG: GyrI-like domain-containing protein [Bacteroidota bacterium]